MSYKCKRTGKVIGPGISEHKIVTETREQRYENPFYKRGRIVKGEVNITYGTEIVEEIRVSPEIYKEETGQEPHLVSTKPKSLKQNFNKPRPKRGRKPRREVKRSPNKRKNQTQDRKKPVIEVVNKLSK